MALYAKDGGKSMKVLILIVLSILGVAGAQKIGA
jgi:hypothetical protein